MVSNRRKRRWPRYAAAVVAAAIGLAAGLLVWSQPVMAAFVCPRCFGLERVAGNLWIERSMPAGAREQLALAAAEGERRLDAIYGALREHPIILACASEACWRRLGGSAARGIAYGSLGLRLSPRGLDPVIIAHERSHIELHGRVGLRRLLQGAVPAWFDEGLAVIVSDDDRYLLPAGAGDRCRAEPGRQMPSERRQWGRQAGADNTLYARAACRVSRWMQGAGGPAGIPGLLDRIAAGERFESLVTE
jgi:hypothetical protein